MQYEITASVFYANKKILDGYVFWRVKDEKIIIVKQSHPNKNIKELLESAKNAHTGVK